MTLRARRILVGLLLLLFAIAAPMILFYAAGYRYNFSRNRIERVGLLYVTTEPNNTRIVLNGQSHEVGRELILNLKPGAYDISILKEGYHSWSKELEVIPGESTFIRDLLLFQDTDPTILHSLPSTAQFLFNTNEYWIFQDQDQLFIATPQGLSSIDLDQTDALTNIQFSENHALFAQNDSWYLLSLTDATLTDVTPTIPEPIRSMRLQNDELFVFTPQIAYRRSLGDSNIEIFLEQAFLQDIISTSNGYWLIASEPSEKRSFLYKLSSVSSRPQLMTSFPYAKQYQIEENVNGFLTIVDQESGLLHLIDTNISPAYLSTLSDIRDWAWSKGKNQLLTTTDFEVSIYHFDNGQSQELIERLSTRHEAVAWHPEEHFIFTVAQDTLYVIERDTRDKRNSIPLVTKNKLRLLGVATDASEVYVSGVENGQVHVWSLAL